MCNKKKVSIVCLLLIIILSVVNISVFAAGDAVDVDSSITIEKNLAEVANICSQANSSVNLKNNTILSYNAGKGLLKFSNKKYSTLDIDEKNTFMQTALSATSKTGLNAKTKNKVYNFIAGQDTAVSNAMKYLQDNANADFLEAKKWFDPFSGFISTILGVLCVAIFLISGMSVLVDVFYLVLPGFQALLDKNDEGKRPIGVSREAYSALKDAEADNEYRNVLTIYLKRRIGLLLVMGLCLGYLISGKIYDFIAFIIDAFSNIHW